jgi:hypothetical protein
MAEAINSATPIPILPNGSMPMVVKSNTLSGAAENLKKRLWTSNRAGIMLNERSFHAVFWVAIFA